MRNILTHEYLDIRWRRIEEFIQKSKPYFKKFIKVVRKMVE
ncbi:MAG TPA: HepT-like ribonuclease domain-containing protein [Candidatus Brocadiia bacterium]|nr:DUF86 domain-containing protein [Planctomycetota bacterium]